ncbi:MAG: bifunctional phosphopantothenoylcysteine decarboxylase/phosphopantothenate--cysteine ligase CoaBC, partial [Pseudomonadota bacterium]
AGALAEGPPRFLPAFPWPKSMSAMPKKIILGVTASIAAYKAAELLRLLRGQGHEVHVVMTPDSRRFVGEVTFQALSGHPVLFDQFETTGEHGSFPHVSLASADLMVVAPATANTIGAMAAGLAHNLLLSAYLAFEGPVVVCPAMNSRMWSHPAVRDNIALLRRRGAVVISPGEGELACGERGEGRLADPVLISDQISRILTAGKDYAGRRVLVTAGATRDPIDSVRFVTNRSSGRMGLALAEAALRRGAEVTLIAANCHISSSSAIRRIDVSTNEELAGALDNEFERSDVLLMTAAVADYKVSTGTTTGKLQREKSQTSLQLVPTSDIVRNLKGGGKPVFKVGFAAEFGAGNIERARSKMRRKGLDMIVFNDVSRSDIGFESDDNEVVIISTEGETFVDKTSKPECAERILDEVGKRLGT